MRIKNFILDRDGTIIEEKQYLKDPKEVQLLPNTTKALKILQDRGIELFIVTNQSGIGRGYFTIEDFYNVQSKLIRLLMEYKITIKDTLFCPHKPDDLCFCRKPRPGMWLSLREKYNLNPLETIVVGDKISDILFGINSKIGYNALVLTGYGKKYRQIYGDFFIDFVANDLLQLVEILDRDGYL